MIFVGFFALGGGYLNTTVTCKLSGRISERLLVKPLQFRVIIQKFKLPISPGLRILRVVCPCFLFLGRETILFQFLVFVSDCANCKCV